MEPWHREIVELHDFFEAYFLGTIDHPTRVEAALADDFTMAGPDGTVAPRAAVMSAIIAGHAHTDSLTITITEPRLIADTDDLVVAEYIENHELAIRSNHRRTTVVFRRDPDGPNGLRWLRAQETWIERGTDR